ncbi:sulfotransferase [Fulvivirgaceae bacterium BMA12]|uniref:Sulfotransferase n=1 Tax=Agaribacillus aureus TaxID=3051825 RepID=A0ABT8LDZ4_9BACT|nr:sulfotransferase [Fulvivirgaceae bacterium BMA12]
MKGIQIIGTQRSGSNLLRVMLNQLPAICAPHPPHILDTFMPYLKQYGSLHDPFQFMELIDDVCQLIESNPVPWVGIQLNRQVIKTRCKTNSLIEIFKVIYELKAEKFGKQFWCCKSMPNFRYFKELELSGIQPFYLHLVRDGRDVAASFKKTPIGEKHVYHLARQWKKDQQASDRILSKVGPRRGIRIHYERLIRSPEETVAKVCNWLNIDFQDSVLAYYQSRESALAAASGDMWANLQKPILSNNHGKFSKELTPGEVVIFEAISGQDLKNYGYQPVDPANLNKNLTEAEIEGFDADNALMKREAIQRQRPDDLKKRLPQQKLKAKIARRNVF